VEIPANAQLADMRSLVMSGGKRVPGPVENLDRMADRSATQLKALPSGCLRFINPHRYKVSISTGLNELRLRLAEEVRQGYG
jgi:nicotinate phosphoribosyltransferase